MPRQHRDLPAALGKHGVDGGAELLLVVRPVAQIVTVRLGPARGGGTDSDAAGAFAGDIVKALVDGVGGPLGGVHLLHEVVVAMLYRQTRVGPGGGHDLPRGPVLRQVGGQGRG